MAEQGEAAPEEEEERNGAPKDRPQTSWGGSDSPGGSFRQMGMSLARCSTASTLPRFGAGGCCFNGGSTMGSRTAEMELKMQGHLTAVSHVASSPSFTMRGRPPVEDISQNAPPPGHYGTPSLSSTTGVKRVQSTIILKGERAAPLYKGEKIPDPTTYDIAPPTPSPCAKLANKPMRFPPKKYEELPGPGQYPPQKTWDGYDGRRSALAGKRKEAFFKDVPVMLDPTRYSNDNAKFKATKAPAWRIDGPGGRAKFASTSDAPGPGAYGTPGVDGLSGSRRVVGRAWMPPVKLKKPLAQRDPPSVQFPHYGLFFGKEKGAGPAAMAQTA